MLMIVGLLFARSKGRHVYRSGPLRFVPRHVRLPGRQHRPLMVLLLAYTGIGLLVVSMVLTMLALHGPSFFVFRQSGTGQSGDGFLSEDQGPGQPSQSVTLVTFSPTGAVITLHATLGTEPAWASVAVNRQGHWVVVEAGASYQGVVRLTTREFKPKLYKSLWTVSAVEESGT